MMAQELAPSDWTQQSFEGHQQSILRGIIETIDEKLGIGIIACSSYCRGQYLVFFLEDIERNKGWQQGIGEKDNIEFEIVEMTSDDESYIADSYLSKRYNYKVSTDHIATALSHLESGSVILEELLFDHPRYEGVVVTEPQPSVQHHAFGSYYGDEEPRQGLIRLVAPYHETQIPPINQRYNVMSNEEEAKILLQPGTMLNFSGRDLLTTRIVVRKGDKVEFDVYRDKSNGDVPYGATNIVFLDPNTDEKRQHGFIYRFLSRPQSQYASDQKFGLIKSTHHEELFWHQSEILDRDEMVQIGDEVEFIREIDEIHGRLKASRITFLPKNTIQLTVLSSVQLMGKVESSTSYNKSPLIEYSNPMTMGGGSGAKQLIEVQSMNSDHYILVKGDAVQFRTESSHENPTKKRAVHVVVTKEVDRTHKGVIYKLQSSSSSSSHHKKELMASYGEIEYHDRGGKKHTIYFYLSEWFDGAVDIYCGLQVEFNILESGSKKRAVRIRPLELPLSKEERLVAKKEKVRRENEERERERAQREERQQQMRDSMLQQMMRNSSAQQQSQHKSNRTGKKPPVLRNTNSLVIPGACAPQQDNTNNNNNNNNTNGNNKKDNVSVSADDSNKSLSKAKSRRMRKRRNKLVNRDQIVMTNNNNTNGNNNNNNNQKDKMKLTQANIDINQIKEDVYVPTTNKQKNKKMNNNNNKEMVNVKGGSNPIPSFDTMIPIEGIVVSPMRSKHGRGTIRYKWKRKRKIKSSKASPSQYEEYEEEKTVEYDYDQKANWQRSIFLTEGDRVRLFFRSINEEDASLAYVALLDPVYKERLYGMCYYYHGTKNYYLQNNFGNQYIELWSYHIVDKKVQSYNLENELLVFDFSERINYNNDNKIATRCRWVRLDDKQWYQGKILSTPTNYTDYGRIKYEDPSDNQHKQIRFSLSSLQKEYRNYQKCGDDVKFHIEHVVTKSTYDVIPATAVHVDTTLLYRPKSKAITK